MIQPVILAAGKGTRMRSPLPKVMHKINGKPMLAHVLETFAGADGYLKPVVVVGYKADVIKNYFGDKLTYATQEVQSGTATAVAAALPLLDPSADAVLVVYGDQPFLRRETLEEVRKLVAADNPDLIVGTVTVPHFEGKFSPFKAFGRIVRASGKVAGIVEYKNATDKQRSIPELNAGTCMISAKWLPQALHLIEPNPQTGELYLTDLAAIASYEGKKISLLKLEPHEALGINSPEDAAQAETFTESEGLFIS